MPVPEILIVTPPPTQTPKGSIAPKFGGAEMRCVGVVQEYERVAQELRCRSFDTATVTSLSKVDGVHLDTDQHAVLGRALAKVVGVML